MTHPDPEAWATDRARELLRAHLRGPWETCDYGLMDAIAQALREEREQGDRAGYQRGIEDAAKECQNHYPRPGAINQYWGAGAGKAVKIEERIRALAKQGGSGGQDG